MIRTRCKLNSSESSGHCLDGTPLPCPQHLSGRGAHTVDRGVVAWRFWRPTRMTLMRGVLMVLEKVLMGDSWELSSEP